MAVSPIGLTTLITPPLGPGTLEKTEAKRGFGESVARALDDLSDAQRRANDLATQAATGDLVDLHDYTIAAAKASVQTELIVTLRDRAVEAFNEIMRMQI